MKNLSDMKFNNLSDACILYSLFFFILFIKSLLTLFELFTYGIYRKEILTESSKLGFDIKIKM